MINREEFEKFLNNLNYDDGAYSKEEIEQMLGDKASRMIGFEQKNAHHCYDLWGHTLHTVETAGTWNDFSDEEKTMLKVAAFFHDIGKPDVAKINERTGQQVFYGHAKHSGEVADPMLKELGYSDEEIERLRFLIEHHDDFISYRYKISDGLRHHEFIREINPVTVAEKMIENKYDFVAMGYNEDQIRAIVYELAHGQKADFRVKDEPKQIDVDMDEVREKMASGKYNTGYQPTLRDYEMLVDLCKSDGNAQSEQAIMNNRVVGTRAGKVAKMGNVQDALEEAYKIAENPEIETRPVVLSRVKDKIEKVKEQISDIEQSKSKPISTDDDGAR